MRHFARLAPARHRRLFHREPQAFTRDDDPEVLAVALGATLYAPAIRPALAADIRRSAGRGVTSMVICLEDAIADDQVPEAEANLVAQLREAHGGGEGSRPLLFIRVRAPEQIPDMVARLGPAAEDVSGFVLPKFTGSSGAAFLDALAGTADATGLRLYGMPVIESPEAIYLESRAETLHDISLLLAKHRSRVLAVRLGATDLCSAYGLRRPRELTIYDIQPVAGLISDVVNILGRAGSGFVITGPVWEYFGRTRMPRSQFFARHDRWRGLGLDGLMREVHLDKANGLTGKTVIHPTHVAAVHALSVVTHEEYCDAADILASFNDVGAGGVLASRYSNKMNEAKPHRAWAQRLQLRAQVFGVAAEGVTVADLLDAAATAA
ncbi:HpcH/HpaI aldolase/citrate lyase family protein [Actinomadura scrupuli]|uniref:HpcH/HpaI aldolase/citrate lyase family protein n=1 Tax=Actinomadura scrupuli TaxID=559629 RepID=UPI003D9575C6